MSDSDMTIQITLDHKPDAVLVLRPGDRLVLHYERPLSAAQADAIRERLEAANVRASLVVEADEVRRIDPHE